MARGLSSLKTNKMSLLFFDLETAVYEENITGKDLIKGVPAQYKKPESIKKYIYENRGQIEAKIIKQRSTDPFSCKVICLSFSFNGEEPQSITGKEDKILEIFQTKIQEHLKEHGGSITGISLVGHNIKKFDAPILFLRACKYGLDGLKQLLFYTRRDIKDTMESGSYFVHGAMVSLDRLCSFFGVPTPKTELDGSKVFKYYQEGKIEEIANYCNKDVEALIKVYDKLSL